MMQSEPQKYPHLESKAKKFQLQEERYTEIERENRILLEKMTTIMSQKPKMNDITSRSIVMGATGSYRQQASITGNRSARRNVSASNPRSERSRMGSANSHSSGDSRNSGKSLNFEQRKRECAKIRDENFQILQRLKEKKSVYNVSHWEQEDMRRQMYLRNISEYPNPRLPAITPIKERSNSSGYQGRSQQQSATRYSAAQNHHNINMAAFKKNQIG